MCTDDLILVGNAVILHKPKPDEEHTENMIYVGELDDEHQGHGFGCLFPTKG